MLPVTSEGGEAMAIKMIGRSGQISLGKEHAGKMVQVDELEVGVWMIKAGEFVPDNERWLHEPEVKARLDRAIAWAESTEPSETDLDELEARLSSGERPARSQSA
jgi:hypothetical protein